MRVSRIATVAIGMVAIGLGILFEQMNIAFLVGLTFGVAASANFPVLIMAMYWDGLTTRGAVYGGLAGLISALALVIGSPSVWVGVLGHAEALFPYDQPALFSMPLAFVTIVLVSKLDAQARPGRARRLRRPVRAGPDRLRRSRRQQSLTRPTWRQPLAPPLRGPQARPSSLRRAFYACVSGPSLHPHRRAGPSRSHGDIAGHATFCISHLNPYVFLS